MIVVDTNVVAYLHCSAYDCEFIAAAQQLDLSLFTEDRALLAAFPAIAQPL